MSLLRPRVPPVTLPLAFFAASFLAMLALFVLLAVWADGLTAHHRLPRNLALTHTATLGWITMTMMGVMYQFVPNALAQPVLSTRLAVLHFAVFLAGWVGLVYGFAAGGAVMIAIFGSAVFTGVVLFLVNVMPAVWRAQHSPTKRHLQASLLFLLVTVVAGVAFALNRQFTWFPVYDNTLAIHALFGLGGWLTLTLIGMGHRMIPAFGTHPGRGERRSWWSLFLAVAGLLVLQGTLHGDAAGPWLALSALPFGAGLCLFWLGAVRHLRLAGSPKSLYDWQVGSSLASLGAAVVLLMLGLLGYAQEVAPYRWPLALGVLVLAGWLGTAVLAQTSRIVPFLIWSYRQLRARPGSGPQAPVLEDLCPIRLGWWATAMHAGATAGIAAALLVDSTWLLRAGAAAGAGGALLHITMLLHATWRRPVGGRVRLRSQVVQLHVPPAARRSS